VVEITEQAQVTDYAALTRALARLRERGALIAVDDAGAAKLAALMCSGRSPGGSTRGSSSRASSATPSCRRACAPG
jgi:hypothetical protein